MPVKFLLLICAGALAVVLSFIANFKTKKDSKRFEVLSKIMSLVFLACYLVRLLQEDTIDTVLGYENSIFSSTSYFIVIALRAVTVMCVLVTVVAPWFKRKHLLNIVSFIVPVVAALNMWYFNINIYAFVDYVKIPSYTLREIQFAIECVLAFGIGIMHLVHNIFISKSFKPLYKEIPLMLIVAIILTPLCMPYGTLGNIWGDIGEAIEDFNTTHLSLILGTFAFILIMFLVLRHRKMEDKRYFMNMFVYVMFIQFFYYYSWPFSPSDIPIHLCHAAVILMLFTYTFRSEKLFYFGFFINTMGALFAMLSPTVHTSLFTNTGIHFWFEHISIFSVPILSIAIGLFPRPKFKSFVWCMIVFTIYYAIVIFLNAYWWDEGANYLFMNGDKIVDVATDVFGPTLFPSINNYFAHIKDDVVYVDALGKTLRFFKSYWIGIYVGYIILILIEWLAYFGLFKVADDHYKLHMIKKEKRMDMMNIGKISKKVAKVAPLYPEDAGKVRISHFSKVYSGSNVKSVDDFSLTVNGGEVYGFLGHNGAGKSTTIKSIVGIQTITEGTISICGFDIEKQAVQAKLNIGYVSDNHAVYEKLTGREYINYIANLYLVPAKEREERFEKYVKMFNLTDAIDREIKGYSHGMKQKVVVIASLMHDPKVWVLDEPLTGLDPTSSFQIKECMRDHANRGNIVFFSSHVIEVVEKICDKICIIGHGKLIGEWDLHKLGEQGITLEQLYMKYVATQNLVTDVDGKTIEEEKGSAKAEVEEKSTPKEAPKKASKQEQPKEQIISEEDDSMKKKRYLATSGPKKAPKKRKTVKEG